MNQIMTREDIERVLEELSALKCKTRKEVEEARVRFLGKKGEVTALFEEFRTIDKELKKEFGKTLNELKQKAQATIDSLRDSISDDAGAEEPVDREHPQTAKEKIEEMIDRLNNQEFTRFWP